MMKCQKCQFVNPERAKFCIECGNSLALDCPKCGAITPEGRKFCAECGYDLREPYEAPCIDFYKPQSYTPKFLVDKILTTRSSIEGERKRVTVLFADVANYTTLSEKLDPEEVHQIMDGCFKILMNAIHRYEGTINQFTGDGVMALFGAPVAHEDHAQRACHAALTIQRGMREYGEQVKKDYSVAFKMRMGLNSGPVVVGAIGDDLRMDYTAVGDTTNLASRMENAAKPDYILLSNYTHRLVQDFFECESLGKIALKGKEEPVAAYALLRPSAVDTRIEAAVAKGLTRFVGRKNAMAALMETYEKSASGSGQVVGILGEAGVGKSRLLLEFRNRLPQDKFTYLEGRCIHFGGDMAYLPILDILRSYFGVIEGEHESVIRERVDERVMQLDEKLKGILSPLHDLLSLEVKDEAYLKLDPKMRRDRVFEALRDLFMRESQNQCLVLAVEDLHWIDKTSEEFLDYFIGWLANAKILLVLLYRPEYTQRWGNKSYFNRVGLDQLNTKSSAELITSILQERGIAPELRDLIADRAGGNPLFMEELTHTLLENGFIEKKNDQYVLSTQITELQVPDTIQGVIAARLDRLEDKSKKIMQVAAVIGRAFAFRILQAISGMREELKDYLLDLQGLEFIYEKSLFPELEYIFKHALTQEVAYNSLLIKRRKEIHEKIGRAIEDLYAGRLEEFYEVLAYHYLKSPRVEKALEYLRLSAEKAVGSNSLWEALRFRNESLILLKRMPETDRIKKEKIAVILGMAHILPQLGHPENPTEIFEEGERLCKELGDWRTMAILYSYVGRYHSYKGNVALGNRYLEQSFHEAEKASDLNILGPLAYGLFASYNLEGKSARIVDMAPRIIRLIEETHREFDEFGTPVNLYLQLLTVYGLSLGYLGSFESGETLCKKGVSLAYEVGNHFNIGYAEMVYGATLVTREKGQEAIEPLTRSMESYEKSQAALFLPLTIAFLGMAYFYAGNLISAEDYMQKGLKARSDSPLPIYLSFHHFGLSCVNLELKKFTKAVLHAEKAVSFGQKNREMHYGGLALAQLGITGWKSQKMKIHEAADRIHQGIRILKELQLKPFEAMSTFFLGELFADGGETEKAQANLKRAEKMLREMGMNYSLGKAKKLLQKI